MGKTMLKRSLIAASMLALCAAAPAQAAGPYSAIYSFGDSLSDVGNVYTYSGDTYPPPPYAPGVYSNGPIWNQVLSSDLGLGTQLPSLLGGTNYAWGGATVINPSPLPPDTPPSLVDQVNQFTTLYPGAAPTNGLYTFSIGANDLFGLLGSGLSYAAMAADAKQLALVVAGEAQALYVDGAPNLVLFDVPDLGVTPYITAQGAAVIKNATKLSSYFDSQVWADLQPLAAEGMKLYDLHTFQLIDDAVKHPAKYGFNNVTDACLTTTSLCQTPDTYLFWDAVHPTAAGHAIIGKEAFDQVTGVPEPSSWALALIGFAGLGFSARRRAALAA
jgi:MYXO-CTERM domain-containing protein